MRVSGSGRSARPVARARSFDRAFMPHIRTTRQRRCFQMAKVALFSVGVNNRNSTLHSSIAHSESVTRIEV